MIVIPLDSLVAFKLLVIGFVFEFLRIVIGYIVGKPPDKIRTLGIEKLEAQREVSQIKSVQLELVRHSLLTRKIIKIDKEVEKLNLAQAPRSKSIKQSARILRSIVYGLLGMYYYNENILMVNPMLLWPLTWFTSKSLIQLPAWFLLIVSGLAWRHLIRSILQVMYRSTAFP